MRKVWLQQSRIGLSLYDISGLGYLREADLENYILEMIPTLPQLDGLEKSFYSFYVCTAVRKFFFFLDPLRTGKIKIQVCFFFVFCFFLFFFSWSSEKIGLKVQ
jgi:serine/threonine-protein phosphatase 2A regulatory subunit B''